MAEFDIVTLDAAQTYDLRRRVLRNGDPAATVGFDGDHVPTTVHLGVVRLAGPRAGEIVATSTWWQTPFEPEPGARAVQLRGMATEPELQGSGLGGMLIEAGLVAMNDNDIEVVWARARSTALGFYLAHGFVAVGDEFVDATTGLAHHVVVIRLA
jgi:predicted GNAT family N-acyltransferase